MILKKISFLLFIFFIGYLSLHADNFPQKSIDGKGFYLYKVNRAEGFYSICKKFDVSKEEIIQFNPSAKYGLKSGQELLIPIKGVKVAIQETESPYFVHTVSAGETLYAISRMYHISTDSIVALNPGSEKGIQIGTKLKIPQINSNTSSDSSISNNTRNQYIFHTIAPKETLFSVSRKYGISVESVLKQNPGLSPSNFSIGKVIRIIPEQNNERVQKNNGPKTFLYTVKKKETLYSIAQQFDITIDDIRACNPGIGEIKKNDTINIPVKESPTDISQALTHEDINQIYNDLYSIEKDGKINVAVLLPFMLSQKEDARSALYLEYYQGFLLAVDSLKKRGTSINVYAYDTEGKSSTLDNILSKPEMKSIDLIIGPADNNLIQKTAEFALKNEINMVNAFSLKNDEANHNAHVLQTNIPHSYLYAEAATELVRQFGNKQVIFLLDDNNADEKKDFINSVKAELRHKNIQFKDLHIASDPELTMLNSSLPENSDILIISNSSTKNSVGKIIAPLTKLKDDRADLSITLFGYPEWQTYTKEYLNNFHKLNTVIFTRFYTNPTDYDWKEFQKKFYFWYNKDMINANPKYGLLGFDTGMYFLSVLKQYGKNFENHLNQVESSSIQTNFKFQRINNWSGFINKSFYFVYFKPSYIIEKRVIR